MSLLIPFVAFQLFFGVE